MKRWRNKLLLAGSAAALLIAIPALSQPEPVLPPGFGEPQEPAEVPPEAEDSPESRPRSLLATVQPA